MLPSEAVGETLLFFASFLFPLLSSTSIYPWLAVIPLQSQLCAHTAFFTFVCVSNLPLPPSCDTWDCNPVQFSSVAQSCLTPYDPMDCSPAGSSVHGDSPGKNTGVGCHFLLQRIFPAQGLNLYLLCYRWSLYH